MLEKTRGKPRQKREPRSGHARAVAVATASRERPGAARGCLIVSRIRLIRSRRQKLLTGDKVKGSELATLDRNTSCGGCSAPADRSSDRGGGRLPRLPSIYFWW